MANEAAVEQIRAKLRAVKSANPTLGMIDRQRFGVLSSGEKIAVAFVLDRADLLHECWGTLIECACRLGPVWLEAALYVQRNGWELEK